MDAMPWASSWVQLMWATLEGQVGEGGCSQGICASGSLPVGAIQDWLDPLGEVHCFYTGVLLFTTPFGFWLLLPLLVPLDPQVMNSSPITVLYLGFPLYPSHLVNSPFIHFLSSLECAICHSSVRSTARLTPCEGKYHQTRSDPRWKPLEYFWV